MRYAPQGVLAALAGVFIGGAATLTPVFAHETDQYAIPAGRQFADLGPYLTAFIHNDLREAVDKLNAGIRAASTDAERQRFYQPQTIADITYQSMPDAYTAIESLERTLHTEAMRSRYPGQVVGYKNQFKASYSHLPIDPRQMFKFWFASTLKAFDCYFGCDKVGHFLDMGKRYFDEYHKALAAGRSPEEAHAAMIRYATEDPVFSESGVLGYLSAGAYSNADLASNYTGWLFYRNLTEPIRLKGQMRPPMLVRDGEFWKLADHVRADSDFFSWFISEHWDEALNPSHYEVSMRGGVRNNVRNRAALITWRYADEHGCLRTPEYFDHVARSLRTYYGENYGHRGSDSELILIGETCFPRMDESKLDAVGPLGHTPLHEAAMRGDVARVRRLLDKGMDVNLAMKPVKPFSAEVGNTPLHLAAAAGSADTVALLLSRGAKVNAVNVMKITPLHRAAGSPRVARLLLDAGADIAAVDATGKTAMHWAAGDERGVETLRLLTARGAAVAADNLRRTPLHIAALRGLDANISELLSQGAAVDTADVTGATPLHLAAAAGHPDVVRQLLTAGAHASATDTFGVTPLRMAERNGRGAVTSVLRSPRHEVYGNPR